MGFLDKYPAVLVGFLYSLIVFAFIIFLGNDASFQWNALFFLFTFFVLWAWVVVDRLDEKGKFKIKGWKWIFYVIGFVGFVNLLFWLIALSRYIYRQKIQKKTTFFGPQFQSLIFIWGVLMTAVICAVVIAIMFDF